MRGMRITPEYSAGGEQITITDREVTIVSVQHDTGQVAVEAAMAYSAACADQVANMTAGLRKEPSVYHADRPN